MSSEERTEFPDYDDLVRAFQQCFRLVREQVDSNVHRKIVQQYIRILKNEGKTYRQTYEETFFEFSDTIGFIEVPDAQLLKEHIFSRLQEGFDICVLRMATGIGAALTLEDAQRQAISALLRPLTSARSGDFFDDDPAAQALSWLRSECMDMPDEFLASLLEDAKRLEQQYRSRGLPAVADKIAKFIGNPYAY
jgi:hypothetical protein